VFTKQQPVVITLILLGSCLRTVLGQTSEAIRKLMGDYRRELPIIRNGREMEVPIARSSAGIILGVGERFPLMGGDGSSAVDEAMVTGESSPSKSSLVK